MEIAGLLATSKVAA